MENIIMSEDDKALDHCSHCRNYSSLVSEAWLSQKKKVQSIRKVSATFGLHPGPQETEGVPGKERSCNTASFSKGLVTITGLQVGVGKMHLQSRGLQGDGFSCTCPHFKVAVCQVDTVKPWLPIEAGGLALKNGAG